MLTKLTLETEIKKLVKLTNESKKMEIANQIKKVILCDGEKVYQIITRLMQEKINCGYTRTYSLNKLKELLPWKKSRLITILQNMVSQDILVYYRKQYKLNKENSFYKRLWNYYNEPNFKDKENIEVIKVLDQRKKEMEKLILLEGKSLRKYRNLTKNENKELRTEIREILEEGLIPNDIVKKRMINILGFQFFRIK